MSLLDSDKIIFVRIERFQYKLYNETILRR
ncbi:MAG: hypothetical protein H6Q59_950 [Firmicutes bacterium]|nr:hypothetical protein [Bacillota bacterium]